MNSNQQIAELAYHLWNDRGRPHGTAEHDWLEAERRLASTSTPAAQPEDVPARAARGDRQVDVALEETFPASDPVASRIPDAPPANADEKWSAAGKAPRRGKSKASAKTAGTSRRSSAPPVDEADDGPATAPGDTGEG